MAIALALMMFIIPLSMSFDMSAEDGEDDGDEPEDPVGGIEFDSTSVSIGSFNERSEGTVSITFTNSKSIPKEITVYATKLNSENKLASKTVTIPGKDGDVNGSVKVSLSFRLSSPGANFVTIHATPMEDFPSSEVDEETIYFNEFNIKIDVSSSIWSNTSTYVVIVIAILLIVVAVYLRLRANRVPKTQGRFTAMEMERRAPKEEEYLPEETDEDVEPVPQKPAKTSEKQEYTGKATSTKKKPQQSSARKSNPNSRRSNKRK